MVWDRVGSPVWKIKRCLASRGLGVLFPVSVGIGPTSCDWQDSNLRPWALPTELQPPPNAHGGEVFGSPGSRVPGGYSFVRVAGAGHGRRLELWGCSALLSAVLFVDKRSRDIADRLASYSSSILAPSLGASGHFLQLLLAFFACTGRSLLQDCEHFGWGVALLSGSDVALWVEFAAAEP